MLNINEYFDGKVKSIAYKNNEGVATVGVMEVGEYEFSTSKKEYMTVVSGVLNIKLPNSNDWNIFKKGESFTVPPNEKFMVEAKEETVYTCIYE